MTIFKRMLRVKMSISRQNDSTWSSLSLYVGWGCQTIFFSFSISILKIEEINEPNCKNGRFCCKIFHFQERLLLCSKCFCKIFLQVSSSCWSLAKFQCLTSQKVTSRFDTLFLGVNLCRFTKSFSFEELSTSKEETFSFFYQGLIPVSASIRCFDKFVIKVYGKK